MSTIFLSTRDGSNHFSIKLLFVLLSSSIFYLPLHSQAISGPGMHWFTTHWYDESETYTPATRDASGEDWYYDIIPYFNDAVLEGYAAFGFSSIVNEEGGHDCFSCIAEAPEVEYFEREGYYRGCNFPKIAEMDEFGNVEWYKIYQSGVGYLRQGIQLSDGSGYVAVGLVLIDGGEDDLLYQYDPALEAMALPNCADSLDSLEVALRYKLLYVIKTDMEGNLINEMVYGLGVPNEVAYNESEGFGIIETSDGKIVIAGLARYGGYWDTTAHAEIKASERGWVFQIDPSTLDLLWETTIMTGDYLSIATALIEENESIYVAGTKSYDSEDPFMGKVNITQLNLAGGVISTFELNTATTSDSDIGTYVDDLCGGFYGVTNSVAYDLAIHDGDLLVATAVNRNKWVRGEAAESIGKIYRIDITPVMSHEGWVEIAEDHQMLTYDLKIGITTTSDGGYAAVTSVHDPDFEEINDCDGYEKTYYPGLTETFSYEEARIWNANAYIAKFSATDALEWEQVYPTTFDAFDESTLFPYDIKRMECYYEILETEDGGFIIAGNNSMNFDDDIVLKTYNDCNRYVEYNTGAGDINVTGIYTISSDVVWDANKKVRGIIEIEDDATLTITNEAVIQFSDSRADNIPTYIIVKRGGRLIIDDGATLTGNAECSTMWEGVYVEGTYGTNHPTQASLFTSGYFVTGDAHGLVKISGEATIENARTGITLGLPPAMNDYPDFGGGILIADQANFIDNAIDIYFWPFDKNNVSFIRHCDLKTMNALPDPIEKPIAHAQLIQVKNVIFRGNVFENATSSAIYNQPDRGAGILAYNATFKVHDNANGFAATGATGSDPNYFTDLHYGVYAAQFTTLSTNIIVNGNVLAENGNGVYIGGAVLPEVNFNTISMPTKSKYGIYLDGCDGYGVEENTITGPGASITGTQIGIVLNESGSGNNQVYRNNLSALKYGVRMQGNNGDAESGLEIKCNTFEEGKYDISLVSGATTATMRKDQGACGTLTSPASNLFTDPSFAGLNTQIVTSIDITGINYYNYTFHLDEASDEIPFAAPDEYSNSIDPWPTGDAEEFGCDDFDEVENLLFDNYCPTNFTSGSGGSSRMAQSGPIRPKPGLMMPLTYNPYTYLKASGVAYEAFLNNIQFNMLASYYMENEYLDSLYSLVSSNDYILGSSVKAQMFADAADYDHAYSSLTEMEGTTVTDAAGYFSELQAFGFKLSTDTLTWLDVDSMQLATVRTEALRNDREGVQARLLLELIAGDDYLEPINILEEDFSDEELRFFETYDDELTGIAIEIYPHPVGSASIIKVQLEGFTPGAQFVISDMQGREVFQLQADDQINYYKVNNTMLKPGTYICYVSGAGSGKLSKKFIVIQ